MTNSKNKKTESSSVGLVESVLEKIKRNVAERDKVLVSYYKSMMGQKNMAYSQTKVCQLAVEYLFRRGFTEISTQEGVRKRLVKLGVIQTK
jgi:hypothetical protein